MALYKTESLDTLRAKVDLVEVLSSHLELKRSGATYKGLCPFHEEKTPSFMVQAGDSHYHCFGCGAHGDAIAFLMNHVKMSFVDAVENLAERFAVVLEKAEGEEKRKGPDRIALKEALDLASRFYHTLLLHTEEGHEALRYLYRREIDFDFIEFFQLGFAPSDRTLFTTFAKKEGITEEVLLAAGLMTEKKRDFFSERITFPIRDPFGAVIGFSARKLKEETFGGKYINTPETPLFKKSQQLFGLNYSRQRIAKERRAIIVEGQVDCLRLIHSGLNITVAAQGTAFGEGHVKLLANLGVNQIYLAMDGDNAGKSAAIKVGNLFQKEGIGVAVLDLPEGSDPDSFVKNEGSEAFSNLLKTSEDYLSFLVKNSSKGVDLSNPAQKNELIRKLTEQIRAWEEPVMVHESLRKIAELTHVPESVVGVGASTPEAYFIKRFGKLGKESVDPHQVLETDLLRWLILRPDPRLLEIAKLNIAPDLFRHAICKRIFETFIATDGPRDLISLGSVLENEEEQTMLASIVRKKVNLDKAEEGLVEVIHRLLIRKWMEEREGIKQRIQSGACSDEEALNLAKVFDEIRKNQPTVVLP